MRKSELPGICCGVGATGASDFGAFMASQMATDVECPYSRMMTWTRPLRIVSFARWQHRCLRSSTHLEEEHLSIQAMAQEFKVEGRGTGEAVEAFTLIARQQLWVGKPLPSLSGLCAWWK